MPRLHAVKRAVGGAAAAVLGSYAALSAIIGIADGLTFLAAIPKYGLGNAVTSLAIQRRPDDDAMRYELALYFVAIAAPYLILGAVMWAFDAEDEAEHSIREAAKALMVLVTFAYIAFGFYVTWFVKP